MTGRLSSLFGENQTLSTGNILAAVQSAAANSQGAHLRIKRLEIAQNGSTTLAMVRGEIATRDTAGTLTVTSQAPKILRPVGGAASGIAGSTAPAGGTARSGIISSADSGGTYTTLRPFNFANTAGYLWKPDPDEEIWIPPSTLFVVRLLGSPTAASGWTFVLDMIEE
jgi:hypothetical protein